MSGDNFKFNAEIPQLMNLIVNAFYSEKEIFLRELISNASDAINKQITLNNSGDTYNIKIRANSAEQTITIQDNGIGMDYDDLQNNLGNIANSGTKAFMKAMKSSQQNSKLIGQFGVGFYSAFLVSSMVDVYTNKNGECFKWSSAMDERGYTINQHNRLTERGTLIVLHIKPSCRNFLENENIISIIKKHSLYVAHPILVCEEHIKKRKNKKEITRKWITINNDDSLWNKLPEDVSPDEYKALYREISKETEDYLAVKHFAVEGLISIKGILFIPKTRNVNPYINNEKQSRLKIYSRNVFIMENNTGLIPSWLNFVYGIVDSENLPLNVSREMLQHNNTIEAIKTAFIVKSMEMLETIAGNDTDMNIFYNNFAKYIKLGIHESPKYKSRLMCMLRFYTSSSGYNYRSLNEYVVSMKKNQSCIYYITGASIETMQQSPFIERLMDNGIEVIYMTDPLDEYMLQTATEYKGYKFISTSSDTTGQSIFNKSLLDEAITTINKTAETPLDKDAVVAEYNILCGIMKEILGNRVSKVILSNRLSTSPACLVTSSGAWTANMERLMNLKSDGDEVSKNSQKPTRILEVNPTHNIILNLKNTCAGSDKGDISNMVNLIYDLSCLNSGFQLENSIQFAHSMYNMIELGLTQSAEEDDEEEEF